MLHPLRAAPTLVLAALLLAGCGTSRMESVMPDSYDAALNDASFAFGMMADVQYCDCPAEGSRYYAASLDKLDAAIDAFNLQALSFAVHLGDLIDRRFESFDDVLPLLDRLNVPVYHVLGNHEYSVDDSLKALVQDRLSMERGYYQFRARGRKNWRFIVLDGNDVSLTAHVPGSPRYMRADSIYRRLAEIGHPHAKPYNGALGRQQLTWLSKTLAAAKMRNEQVIIFSHFPVFPASPHNLWNDLEVRHLLEMHGNVVAVFSGHDHWGRYHEHNGIHHLTLPGMVETPFSTSYATTTVHSDRLEILGVERAPTMTLPFGPRAIAGTRRPRLAAR